MSNSLREPGRHRDSPEQAGEGAWSQAPVVVSTGYYAPVPEEKHQVRLEVRGDELRVFLDGGLLLTAKRPEGSKSPASPAFLALRQIYGSSKVHAVRVYQLGSQMASNVQS